MSASHSLNNQDAENWRFSHWTVFLAGSTMMIIFWAVTPLISSAFTRTQTARSVALAAKSSLQLLPFAQQFSAMSTSFEMTAYGYLWLGQNLPQFTSSEAAFVPFYVDGSTPPGLLNATLTARTNMYYTTLQCNPALVNRTKNGLSYSDRKGCITDHGAGVPCSDCLVGGLYIGWYLSQFSSWSLSGIGCPSAINAHKFLAIWGQNWTLPHRDPFAVAPTKVTAFFCEPEYWSQDADIEVDATNKSIIKATPVGEPKPLTNDQFNISNFEYIVGTGANVVSPRADASQTSQGIDQTTQLVDIGWDVSAAATNMVGYAAGSSRVPMQSYMDASTLISGLERAHRLLFALCIQGLLQPTAEEKRWGTAIVRGNSESLTLLRPLAITS